PHPSWSRSPDQNSPAGTDEWAAGTGSDAGERPHPAASSREGSMDPRQIANTYYDAWRTRAGDMTGVPLADEFAFHGPVADFDSADGFRAMARKAGAAVRDFRVRHQFTDGDLVCSVIDWQMAPLPGTLTAAEILHIHNGTIVRGELIYD